ncbi:hypothetical protein SK128_016542 [Halocaridina rubra]|uniref:Uncharacterized protein n=1 Tax=Halocaridina rubra TaxID=373956 RepID=A0AAN8W8G3_HALRR
MSYAGILKLSYPHPQSKTSDKSSKGVLSKMKAKVKGGASLDSDSSDEEDFVKELRYNFITTTAHQILKHPHPKSKQLLQSHK